MFGVMAVIPEFRAQKYEISLKQKLCSKTYTLKVIKISDIVLTIIQTVKS